MARDNEVWLHGQIRDLPRIYINENGDPFRAYLFVRVLRRSMSIPGKEQTIQLDCPIIRTENPAILKQIIGSQSGDMLDIKGVLSSKDVIKSSICPECGQKNKITGSIVYITPIYICRRERALSDVDGFKLLKERNEISNTATIIGTLCKDPEFRTDQKKRFYAQYKIAINRRYRIKEDSENEKVDYVYVKTYGTAARIAAKRLHENSTVMLKAYLQTRDITRTSVCEHCGAEYDWSESVTELVPYYTGFISDCEPLDETPTKGSSLHSPSTTEDGIEGGDDNE